MAVAAPPSLHSKFFRDQLGITMVRRELRSRRLMTFILSTVALSGTSQTRGERERERERESAFADSPDCYREIASSEYSAEGNLVSHARGIRESRRKRSAEKLSDRRRFLDWESNEQRARANAIAIGRELRGKRELNQFPAAVVQLRRF